MPFLGINAVEMAFDVVHYLQRQFYAEFPRCAKDDEYNFKSASTLKPTQISTAAGSLNQIPPLCTVSGDIRVSPFYDVADVRVFVEECVRAINADPEMVNISGSHGPCSKYVLPELGIEGKVYLKWLTNVRGWHSSSSCALFFSAVQCNNAIVSLHQSHFLSQ